MGTRHSSGAQTHKQMKHPHTENKFENERASLPGSPNFYMDMASGGWPQLVNPYCCASCGSGHSSVASAMTDIPVGHDQDCLCSWLAIFLILKFGSGDSSGTCLHENTLWHKTFLKVAHFFKALIPNPELCISAPLCYTVSTSAPCPHLTKRNQLAWNYPQRFAKAKDERAKRVFLDFCVPLMRKREFCSTPQGHILTAEKPTSIWSQPPAASRI